MATKEEVQAEVDAANKLLREKQGYVLTCRDCKGAGYKDYPIFGDWALGSDRMRCFACNGTGNRIKFRKD